MSRTFDNATSFNGDVTTWDTLNVLYMDKTFEFTPFNRDLSGWDVSRVETMIAMLAYATSFDQDLSSWDVSNVRNQLNMFFGASSFRQDLCNWGGLLQNPYVANQMFANTNCETTDTPKIDIDPQGPFCFPCGGSSSAAETTFVFYALDAIARLALIIGVTGLFM